MLMENKKHRGKSQYLEVLKEPLQYMEMYLEVWPRHCTKGSKHSCHGGQQI
jgi:hypothetical protein